MNEKMHSGIVNAIFVFMFIQFVKHLWLLYIFTDLNFG